ncbi:hypothetical protein ACFWVH_48625, partial [Streptomyces sp. NPDC058656]
MHHDGRALAGVSEPRESRAGADDNGSRPPLPKAAASDRSLTFAGVALAAVYVPDAGNGDLRLVETAGRATSRYLPPERLPLSGDSPAAHGPQGPVGVRGRRAVPHGRHAPHGRLDDGG